MWCPIKPWAQCHPERLKHSTSQMFSFPHTDNSSAVLTRKLFPDCVLLVWLGYGSPYPDVMKGTGHWYVMHMQSRSRKPPSDLKSICLRGDSIPCFTSILNAFLEWSIDISQTNLFCVPQNALPRNVWDVKCLLIILGDSACVGSGVGAGSLVDDDVVVVLSRWRSRCSGLIQAYMPPTSRCGLWVSM